MRQAQYSVAPPAARPRTTRHLRCSKIRDNRTATFFTALSLFSIRPSAGFAISFFSFSLFLLVSFYSCFSRRLHVAHGLVFARPANVCDSPFGCSKKETLPESDRPARHCEGAARTAVYALARMECSQKRFSKVIEARSLQAVGNGQKKKMRASKAGKGTGGRSK